MASVNKVIVDIDALRRLYVEDMKSIPIVSKEIGVAMSTVRSRLKELGLLRERADAIRLASKQGRIGVHLRGKKRVFTEEWRSNLATSLRRSAEKRAKGISLKPSGYLEYTRGKHKGRSVHVVAMEAAIGRSIANDEVVHHKDHDKSNNAISNLQLMSRKDHAALHATENYRNRERAENGQFK